MKFALRRQKFSSFQLSVLNDFLFFYSFHFFTRYSHWPFYVGASDKFIRNLVFLILLFQAQFLASASVSQIFHTQLTGSNRYGMKNGRQWQFALWFRFSNFEFMDEKHLPSYKDNIICLPFVYETCLVKRFYLIFTCLIDMTQLIIFVSFSILRAFSFLFENQADVRTALFWQSKKYVVRWLRNGRDVKSSDERRKKNRRWSFLICLANHFKFSTCAWSVLYWHYSQ